MKTSSEILKDLEILRAKQYELFEFAKTREEMLQDCPEYEDILLNGALLAESCADYIIAKDAETRRREYNEQEAYERNAMRENTPLI